MQILLKNNQCYFIFLFVINSVGFFIIKLFVFFLVDFDLFVNGVIFDGWGLQDVRFQSVIFFFCGYWYGFIDFLGIEKVFMGLGNKFVFSECDFRKEEIVLFNINFYMLFGFFMILG